MAIVRPALPPARSAEILHARHDAMSP
jgi:hypothetical protein